MSVCVCGCVCVCVGVTVVLSERVTVCVYDSVYIDCV